MSRAQVGGNYDSIPVIIAAGQNLKEDTVLFKTAGKWKQANDADAGFPAGGVGDAELAVLAGDVDATSEDKAGTAFVTGRFDKSMMLLGGDDTIEAYELRLRELGLIMKDVSTGGY